MDAKEAAAQLRLVLAENKDFCRIIISHLDPDSMGSAIAFQALLKAAFGRDSSILYSGAVSNQQNRTIVMRLNLHQYMKPISSDSHAVEGLTIYLDFCSGCDGRLPKSFVFRPRIIIDHHREGDAKKEEHDGLVWIDDIGANATLIVELCQELCPKVLEDPFVALLLALAIHTDTDEMRDPRNRDREAMTIVCKHADMDAFHDLINFSVEFEDLQCIARAIDRAEFDFRGNMVTGVGVVEKERADIVSTVSEYLRRTKNVTRLIVWVVVNGTVRISARSRQGSSAELGKFLREKFGDGGCKYDSYGNGSGGAVITLPIPSELLEKPERIPFLEAWVDRVIKSKVFEG